MGQTDFFISAAYSADINIAECSETLVHCRYSCPRTGFRATFAAGAGETEQIVPESLNAVQKLCCHIKEKTYFYLELHRNV